MHLRARRVPERLRQDEPRDADPARRRMKGWKIWTVGDDIAWMRVGAGRPAVGGQPGGRLLRRRARHELQDEPERDDDDRGATRSSRTSRSRPTATCGGRATTSRAADGCIDWQGRPWTPGVGEKAAHPNSRFTAPGDAVPDDLPRVADARGRPDQRDHLRRPPPRARPARVPVVQLAARRVPRRDAGLRDDRRGHRQGRRRAPRPDGDAALLRLQHGRLLRPLARGGEAARRTRRRSSASTGSGRTPRGASPFLAALRDGLRGDIPLRLVEAHVNDPAFGHAAAEAFLELMTE